MARDGLTYVKTGAKAVDNSKSECDPLILKGNRNILKGVIISSKALKL